MRQVDHQTVVDELEQRGYNLEWVRDYDADNVDDADDILEDDVSTSEALDWFEVEGQVTDGMFEDPYNGPEYDFTLLLTDSTSSGKLVGRMMYYMVSAFGLDYTYEHLVDDIEELANHPYYDAPFDRSKALEGNPTN